MSKWRGWHRLTPPRTPWGNAAFRALVDAPYLPQQSGTVYSHTASGGLASGGSASARLAFEGLRVVFAQSDVVYTGQPQFSTVAPDPGTLALNDVVLVFIGMQNGQQDGGLPAGWTFLSGAFEGGNGEFFSLVYGRRATAGQTLATALRTFNWFVNTTGSRARIATVVLRGVRDSGLLAFDLPSRLYSVVQGVGVNSASLLSASRAEAKMLALHFAHVRDGAIGAAPSGWSSVLADEGPADSSGLYIEARTFGATGTTTAQARTPSPLRYGTALIHALPAFAPNDYAAAGSGGVTTGGTAPASYSQGSASYPYTASGGATLGGAALRERTYSRQASGGVLLGGFALVERNFQPAVGGNLVLGGAAAIERTYARAASGGLVAGGAAVVAFQSAGFSFTASGGVTLGGAALLERAYSWAGSGGAVTGGAAALERTYSRAGTGGLVLGGAAGLRTTVAPPVGGDIASGGAATIARTFAHTSAGGLVTGGEAGAEYQQGSPSHVASGGVVVGGEGFAYRVYTYVGQPPELGTGPGEPQPPQVIVQETGGGYVEFRTATLVYAGGGLVRIRGAAQASATIREPANVLRLASGPRMRLRGSANAYALPRPRRNRDLEDLALANLARTAR